jgi:hypothetical protein
LPQNAFVQLKNYGSTNPQCFSVIPTKAHWHQVKHVSHLARKGSRHGRNENATFATPFYIRSGTGIENNRGLWLLSRDQEFEFVQNQLDHFSLLW